MVNKYILFDIIKKELIERVNIYDSNKIKKGRNYKYSNLDCINVFLTVLFEGRSYRDACTNFSKHSFTSIFKRIKNWELNNVFNDLFKNITNKYKKNKIFSELYVDSTDIQNICGLKDNVDYSYKFKSKRALKITVICDEHKIPVNYDLSKSSKKDCVILKNMINDDNIKFKNKVYMSADKGYFTKKETKMEYKKRGIILALPKKNYNKKKKKLKTKWFKRPRVRHSNKMKLVLKSRFKVENLFARLHKTFKRISKLYDKHIRKYKMFIEIAICGLILELNM
jgi:transposase